MKFFVVFFTLCAAALAAPSPQLLTYAAGSPYYSQHLIGAPFLQAPAVATPLLAKRLDGREAPASTVHADHVASAPIISEYFIFECFLVKSEKVFSKKRQILRKMNSLLNCLISIKS